MQDQTDKLLQEAQETRKLVQQATARRTNIVRSTATRDALAEEVATLEKEKKKLLAVNSSYRYQIMLQIDEFKQLKESIVYLNELTAKLGQQAADYKKREFEAVENEIRHRREELAAHDDEIAQQKLLLEELSWQNERRWQAIEKVESDTAERLKAVGKAQVALQEKLAKLGVKENIIIALQDEVSKNYAKSRQLLEMREELLAEGMNVQNKTYQKLEQANKLLKQVSNDRVAFEAEKEIERKRQAEVAEEQRVKQVQLDMRQASLQKLFDKLHNSGSV